MSMKELMQNWVDSHKTEYVDDGDWETPDGKVFNTEEEIDDYLWNYIIENPDLLYSVP